MSSRDILKAETFGGSVVNYTKEHLLNTLTTHSNAIIDTIIKAHSRETLN